MPDHPVALEILERTGPLAVSSANLTGRPAATEADDAEEMLGEDVEVIVDGGTSPGGNASTIVDATATPGRVLRLGAISIEQLNQVLEPLGHPLPDPDASDDPEAEDTPS
jgi:L-threonylcarbamoyladenylate synthase